MINYDDKMRLDIMRKGLRELWDMYKNEFVCFYIKTMNL